MPSASGSNIHAIIRQVAAATLGLPKAGHPLSPIGPRDEDSLNTAASALHVGLNDNKRTLFAMPSDAMKDDAV